MGGARDRGPASGGDDVDRSGRRGEDLVQDTLIRAYRAVDRFDGEHAGVAADDPAEHEPEPQPPPAAGAVPGTRPGGRGVRGDDTAATHPRGAGRRRGLRRRRRAGARRAAPARFRRVVELVDVAGLSYAEAASVLDIPAGTVMSRLHRARNRIRSHLLPLPPATRGRGRTNEAAAPALGPIQLPRAGAVPAELTQPGDRRAGGRPRRAAPGGVPALRVRSGDVRGDQGRTRAARRSRGSGSIGSAGQLR